MKLLRVLSLAWRMIRLGRRAADVLQQSNFWADECHAAFKRASEAFARGDKEEWDRARHQFQIARHRFETEGRELLK